MSGILCNSSSATMLAAATSADNSVSGRVTGEQCTLTVSPSGTDYSWSSAIPSSSSAARSALSASTGASITFTPDVAGTYTITCIVDSVTTYVLRIGVTSTAISQLVEAIRHSPKTDASVPAPAVGLTQFYSSDQGTLCVKNSAGTVTPIAFGVGPFANELAVDAANPAAFETIQGAIDSVTAAQAAAGVVINLRPWGSFTENLTFPAGRFTIRSTAISAREVLDNGFAGGTLITGNVTWNAGDDSALQFESVRVIGNAAITVGTSAAHGAALKLHRVEWVGNIICNTGSGFCSLFLDGAYSPFVSLTGKPYRVSGTIDISNDGGGFLLASHYGFGGPVTAFNPSFSDCFFDTNVVTIANTATVTTGFTRCVNCVSQAAINWTYPVADGLIQIDSFTAASVFAAATPHTFSNCQAHVLSNAGQFSAGNSGAAITLNFARLKNIELTLTANCTLTMTTANVGSLITLKLTQDATGSRTVTWPAAVDWPGGVAPTLTAAANAVDIFQFYCDGTKMHGHTFALNSA